MLSQLTRSPGRADLEGVSLVSLGAEAHGVVVLDDTLGVKAATGPVRARVHALALGHGAHAVAGTLLVDHALWAAVGRVADVACDMIA